MLLNTFTRIQFESGFVDMWDPVFGWTQSLLARDAGGAAGTRSTFNICKSTGVWREKSKGGLKAWPTAATRSRCRSNHHHKAADPAEQELNFFHASARLILVALIV